MVEGTSRIDAIPGRGDELKDIPAPPGIRSAAFVSSSLRSPLRFRFHRSIHLPESMKRKGSAVWKGGLRDGKGTVSSASGVLADTQYSFNTRFEEGIGTNPEELIAAAHAGCFSMALSGQLGAAGMTAESIETTATVSLDKQEVGWAITAVHLDVTARIPGGDQAAFDQAAANAKAGCPVSKVLHAEITMTATLVA